ncbi:hypothetical protein ACU686_23930 [Yinghuangia aomiensis]
MRGQILDDKGRPLVANKAALVVTVNRTDLSSMPDKGSAVLTKLAGVLVREGRGPQAQGPAVRGRTCRSRAGTARRASRSR